MILSVTGNLPPARLPPTVRVIVRGMLNCNQVVLREPGDNVLVDSGYSTHRERTLELVAGPAGLEGEPLERLINTHCHTDHMGGNAAIASAHGCRVTIPEGEAKYVDPWTAETGSLGLFDHKADPFRFDDTLRAGDCFGGGGFGWHVHAAPGHDMAALVFFEPRHRILISGDALWQTGMGIVWPEAGPNHAIEAALETLARIERLDPAVVIPGHGAPFDDVASAIATARSRLAAFAADPAKNARQVARALFVFALLDRQSMPLSQVAEYVGRVPCYRQLSEGFLGLDPAALADWLVSDLQRAGAIVVADGIARPTGVA
jgi:glyoxylase-like metal-dependent hydrolase (beta-lactamase superfamily II)